MNKPHRLPFCLLVLSAGASSRMGQPKALLTGPRGALEPPLQPLLERWFVLGEAAGLGPIRAVLGVHAPEITTALPHRRDACLINPDPQRGMSSSLLLGLQALQPFQQSCLVTPVDCPPEPAEGFLEVLSCLHQQTAGRSYAAALPTFQGVPGHPVLLSQTLISELCTQEQLEPLDHLLARTPQVLRVDVPRPEILVNLNTPAELQRWQRARSIDT